MKCNYESTQSHSRVDTDSKNRIDTDEEVIDDDIVFIGSTHDGLNEIGAYHITAKVEYEHKGVKVEADINSINEVKGTSNEINDTCDANVKEGTQSRDNIKIGNSQSINQMEEDNDICIIEECNWNDINET